MAQTVGPNGDQDRNDHLQAEEHQLLPEIIHPSSEANINHVGQDIPPEAAILELDNIQQNVRDPAIRDRVIIGETEEQVEMRGDIIMELGEAPPDRIDAFWTDPAIRAVLSTGWIRALLTQQEQMNGVQVDRRQGLLGADHLH